MRRQRAASPRVQPITLWLAAVLLAGLAYAVASLSLNPPGPVSTQHMLLAVAAVLAAGLAQVHIRVGSHVISFEWGEAALVLQFALLPMSWVAPTTAVGFCIANLFSGRRIPIKLAYNTAMWFLAAGLTGVVFAVVAAGEAVFTPRGLVAAAAASLTFAAATRVLTSVVVSLAQGRPTLSVLADGIGISALVWAGNLGTAVLVLAIARWNPASLWLLPPTLLACHIAYRGTVRARRDRDSWRGLAVATKPLVGDTRQTILRAAAARAVQLFDAHHIEVSLPAEGSAWLRIDPSDDGSATDTAPHFVQVPLDAADADAGALRLGFTAEVSLTAEEQLSLQTFAHWLAGTLKQASLMAASSELASQKAYEAAHDALTGLANRTTLLDRGTSALSEANLSTDFMALLLIDLDHFKEVNDTLGHGAGDILLKIVASRLADRGRSNELVARLGGDEFAVFLSGLRSAGEANDAARRFADALGAPVEVDSYRLAVEGSVGIAVYPEDGATMSDLLRRADVALYQAKSDPTGIARYDVRNDATSVDRLSLLPEVQAALVEGHIRLHYQPKYDLLTGRPIGAEALARWFHPEQGVLPPNLWIPAVEQSTLIREFTKYVLDRAIADCAGWPIDLHTVAVNLSARSLLDGDLPDTVAELLAKHELPPSRLVLEITETVMMSSLDTVEQTLAGLRALGVGLSVDDFGTGYSSLTFLARQTVNEVKLDRSFIATMASSIESASIVGSVVDLAQKLNLGVVAEGVETAAQEQMLRELGCHVVQGFRFSRPVPADKIAELLLGSLDGGTSDSAVPAPRRLLHTAAALPPTGT